MLPASLSSNGFIAADTSCFVVYRRLYSVYVIKTNIPAFFCPHATSDDVRFCPRSSCVNCYWNLERPEEDSSVLEESRESSPFAQFRHLLAYVAGEYTGARGHDITVWYATWKSGQLAGSM